MNPGIPPGVNELRQVSLALVNLDGACNDKFYKHRHFLFPHLLGIPSTMIFLQPAEFSAFG
jgi:hypothetical protein